MAKAIQIQVEPSILKYARYVSGYNAKDASTKLKISEERLRNLEEEKEDISLSKIRKFSEVYKMPLVYFLLETPPKDKIIPDDFRIIYGSENNEFSHSVMMAVRKARYVQSVIKGLQEDDIDYGFNSARLDDNIEKISSDFLSILNVSVKDKKKWSNPSSALTGWKDSVEKLGIFILQQSLPKDDVSAFSLADEKPYIIMLNSSDHENRRIFSLFHEIGHILLHKSGVCVPDNLSRNSFEYIKIEKFCNHFASSVLVPVKDFKSNDIVIRLSKTNFDYWNSEDIKHLASNYKVSKEVIYRRLVQIGVLKERDYEIKRNELIKGFEEYKKIKNKNLIIPQYRKIISRNGKAFTSLVLNSMNQSRITLTDVSSFLGTTSKHISAVEAKI